MKLSILLAAALAAGISGAAAAADQAGKFSVRGLGTTQCSALQDAVSKKDSARLDQYSHWFAGYLSASNRLIGRTFDAVPTTNVGDIVGLVSVVCKNNPAMLVETAMSQALNAINTVRLQAESPLVQVTAGQRSLSIRQEALQTLQSRLQAAGLYKGAVDGKATPALIEAIKQFQKREKLVETGLPDIDVLLRASLKATAAASKK